MELTKMERILWDNDLKKMLTNHLEDVEDSLEWTKGCPQRYQQLKEIWTPQMKYWKGKIAGLKQAIKLIECLEYNQKIKGE